MREKEFNPRAAFSRAGLALALMTIVGVGLVFVAGQLARQGVGNFDRIYANVNLQLLASYIPLYGIGFLVFWLVIRRLPVIPAAKMRMGFGRLFMLFCIGYAFSFFMNLIATFITRLAGAPDIGQQAQQLLLMDSPLAVIVPVIVAPVVEELIFRKMLIDRLGIYGEKTAIVFSAVCFGLFHRNLTQFLYAAVLGLVFGYVYSRSRKVHYTMIMHFCLNGFSTLGARAASGMLKTLNSGTPSFDEIMHGSSSSMAGTALFGLGAIALVIMGITFFFIRISGLRFYHDAPYELPKGSVFRTAALNFGFLLFAAVCIASIILNFIGFGL